MQQSDDLSPLEIVEMFAGLSCFLKDSSDVSQTLLDDFRIWQGYNFLCDLLLRYARVLEGMQTDHCELFLKRFLNKEQVNKFEQINWYGLLWNEDIGTKSWNYVLLSVYEYTLFNFLFVSIGLLLNVSVCAKKADA